MQNLVLGRGHPLHPYLPGSVEGAPAHPTAPSADDGGCGMQDRVTRGQTVREKGGALGLVVCVCARLGTGVLGKKAWE